MSRTRLSTRMRCLVVAVGLLGAACKGPVAPLDVRSKDVALDLLLGASQKAVAGAPLPPVAFDVTPGGIPSLRTGRVVHEGVEEGETAPDRPRRVTTTTVDTGECGTMDPLAVPKKVAFNMWAAAPVAASYKYRTEGAFTTGGVNPSETKLPTEATMTVKDPVFDTTALETRWSVAVKLGDVTTTTGYRATLLRSPVQVPPNPTTPGEAWMTVEQRAENPFDDSGGGLKYPQVLKDNSPKNAFPDYPGGPAEEAVDDNARPPRSVAPGLFITKVESSSGLKPFEPPAPGLLLAALPLAQGTSYDIAASDGTTTMSYRSTILEKATVDACGTPLDSWTVELTKGKIASVNNAQVVNFTARYQIGTQYGYLVLADHTEVTGVENATPIVRSVQMTITREPRQF